MASMSFIVSDAKFAQYVHHTSVICNEYASNRVLESLLNQHQPRTREEHEGYAHWRCLNDITIHLDSLDSYLSLTHLMRCLPDERKSVVFFRSNHSLISMT